MEGGKAFCDSLEHKSVTEGRGVKNDHICVTSLRNYPYTNKPGPGLKITSNVDIIVITYSCKEVYPQCASLTWGNNHST